MKSMTPIIWIDRERFSVGSFLFRAIEGGYKEHFTSKNEIIIIKPRHMLDWYERFFASANPKKILEFGIFQGGSEILILLINNEAKLVAIDLDSANETILEIIRSQGWDDRCKLHFGISQDNIEAVQNAIYDHFGSDPLDLIIDDASHLYGPTRRAFEIAFPSLQPGGAYIIEDWGWANWPGMWQLPTGQWHDQSALTNLVFELTMVAASRPDIVAGVEIVSKDIIVIRRGDWISDGKPLVLEECYMKRGRELSII